MGGSGEHGANAAAGERRDEAPPLSTKKIGVDAAIQTDITGQVVATNPSPSVAAMSKEQDS